MKRETLIWTILLVAGAAFLTVRAVTTGMGTQYVRAIDKQYVEVQAPAENGETEVKWVPKEEFDAAPGDAQRTATESIGWTRYEATPQLTRNEQDVAVSYSRTFGTWFAAFLTLCIFSFLYRDNGFYKLAESIFIGVSAGYWMVVGFWSVIVPNLAGSLAPGLVRASAMPGLETQEPHYVYIVPLILAVMLLWRLMPAGAWISRWPLALFIGVFAGLRMIQFIQADFLNQIRNGILPLIVTDTGGPAWQPWTTSVWNIVSVFGVLACLTYFFFSFEHKGAVGRMARIGTWILMITFGAMFGYTVMGRIALLTGRLEFLFIDWLWLIDPTGTRSV